MVSASDSASAAPDLPRQLDGLGRARHRLVVEVGVQGAARVGGQRPRAGRRRGVGQVGERPRRLLQRVVHALHAQQVPREAGPQAGLAGDVGRGLLDGGARELDRAVDLPGPARGRGGGDQDVDVVDVEGRR